MAKFSIKNWADFLWPLGATLFGVFVMPFAIAQYPDFFNGNKWILPFSVAAVLVCWAVPLILHDRTRRWASHLRAIPKYGDAALVIIVIAVISGFGFGARTLFRSHEKHLLVATAKPDSKLTATGGVEPPTRKPSIGFLQLSGNSLYLYKGQYWVDTIYNNGGSLPVEGALIYAEVSIADMSKQKNEGSPDTELAQDFQERILRGLKENPVQGSNVGVDKGLWTSVRVPDVSDAATKGLRDGSWRIYFLSTTRWGEAKPNQQQWNCSWISEISLPLPKDSKEVVHNCEIRLKRATVARSSRPPLVPHPCPKVGVDVNVTGGIIKNLHSSGCFETGISIKGHPDTVDGVTADTGSPARPQP
jgi:hypothetical protein